MTQYPAECPQDQYYFAELRKIRGKLSQEQVDAAKSLFVLGYRDTLRTMVGLPPANSTDMTTSLIGQDFIKGYESLELKAYKPLSHDVWTIGWGTTVYPDGTRVRQGDVITRAQADAYFAHDLARFEDAVNEIITVPMTQNLFDALVSLVYNIGISAFSVGSVDDKINAGNMNAAYTTWAQYVNSGGKRVQGLVNRRAAEIKMAQAA